MAFKQPLLNYMTELLKGDFGVVASVQKEDFQPELNGILRKVEGIENVKLSMILCQITLRRISTVTWFRNMCPTTLYRVSAVTWFRPAREGSMCLLPLDIVGELAQGLTPHAFRARDLVELSQILGEHTDSPLRRSWAVCFWIALMLS